MWANAFCGREKKSLFIPYLNSDGLQPPSFLVMPLLLVASLLLRSSDALVTNSHGLQPSSDALPYSCPF